MREACCLWLSATDRARLAALVADRNSPQKHVWRAQIVLLSADRLGTVEIMRRTGKAKASVWRWQARFMEAGVDGLLRDKTRPSRIPRLAARAGRAGGRPHAGAAAGRGDALDRARDGGARSASRPPRCSGSGRPTACSRTGCGPSSSPRPGVRRQAARRGRALRRPAGACGGALGRREDRHVWMAPGSQGAVEHFCGGLLAVMCPASCAADTDRRP